ncbi:unnamed protein product [Peronospora belbahrii]|uniref:Helicase ATP-binding domain-containing protein n=1 Tax=Peronospora belbahrii TaxID=622444 RepID=A0ABN8CLW1_9STRA|nr:unnamed protein product [Peronospora belbahrii]
MNVFAGQAGGGGGRSGDYGVGLRDGLAEIVFVPYNYLIDPLARRTVGISIENSILIFDEAHNAELIASEAASSSLSSNDIVVAFQSLTIESIQTLQALFMEIDRASIIFRCL